MNSKKNYLKFFALLVCLSLIRNGYAVGALNSDSELVTFFKRAINSPPDIEKFVAKRTNLLNPINTSKTNSLGSSNLSSSGSTSYESFEGALSGTNFFLRNLSDADLLANSNFLGTVTARSASSTYEIGGHGIIYGMGENGLTEDVMAKFRVARQILDMGIGEIEPETVNWIGNEFSAKNSLGKDVHGILQVSNNIPFRLEVSLSNELIPYKVIVYTYSTPPDLFAGYPVKFLISKRFEDGLKPLAEVEFKSVLIATQQLSASFFNETRFAAFIGYTNVYSNLDYYVSKPKTNQLIKLNFYGTSGGITNSRPRTVIYICFFFATLLPLVILSIWLVRKQKK